MPRRSLRDTIDGALGDGIEALTVSHHRRRLGRIGWSSALEGRAQGWADGDPPPRSGNAVRVLIDGDEAFPAMAEAIRGARSHVSITGWHVTPDFALTRDDRPVILRELLAERAQEIPVRVLIWGGAPVPLLRPWRGDVRKIRERLMQGTRIRCALDERERPMHCHHEKTIVVDDRIAFVGGIDLTSFDGDRWDRTQHPAREADGWHDVAVRLEGPAVKDVADNFALRWAAITGEKLPNAARPSDAGTVDVQVVRTMPEQMYPQRPNGDFRILESYLSALRAARRFIYLENQYLWSPEIIEVLRDKLGHPPVPDFRLVLLLPAKPTQGGDDTRGQLGTLIQADDGQGRLLATTLYASGRERDWQVYVHAKVGIVDDSWMTIGSANLNEHSLFNDTEMNVVIRDPALIRDTRLRLWAAHTDRSTSELSGEPQRVIDDVWKPIAYEQRDRRKRGERMTHKLAALPGVSRRSGLMLGPLQGVVVDG
jgi:phosphatidylserine/phosphatidylglycerophosphate/cardiolipin synthase-like enzyme